MATLGIKDIALMAKVSPATVSRVLSSPELVSPKTLTKVKKIIDELGYKPNRLGTSLRTRKSGNIVAIMPEISKPVNSGIIRALEQEAQKHGYSVLLGDTQGLRERELHYGSLVKHGQADGILLFAANLPFEENELDDLPPIVNVNEMVSDADISWVAVDNEGAAREATEYLISLGHTRIAAVTGPGHVPSSNQRLAGYKKALQANDLAVDERLIVHGNYTLKSGVDTASELLSLRDRPTAIFAFNDDMAIGVMNVLQKNDYQVPRDISVMGFDDITYASYVTPSLTTIHQPLEDIGQTCASQLVKRIKDPSLGAETNILAHELMVRSSTGPAPSGN